MAHAKRYALGIAASSTPGLIVARQLRLQRIRSASNKSTRTTLIRVAVAITGAVAGDLLYLFVKNQTYLVDVTKVASDGTAFFYDLEDGSYTVVSPATGSSWRAVVSGTTATVRSLIGASAVAEGTGTVSGVITANGVAAANYKVLLIGIESGIVAGSAQTDATGAYSFSGIGPGNYSVLPIDPARGYRSKTIHTYLAPPPVVPPAALVLAASSPTSFDGANTLTIANLTGAIASVTILTGSLPAGMSVTVNANTLYLATQGSPTQTPGTYNFTVRIVDSVGASIELSGSLVIISRTTTLQGATGLTLVRSGSTDDQSVLLPALASAFTFFGTAYQNNIYVGSNSYLTFGYGSTTYSGLSASNPGRGVIVNAADRSYDKVYAGNVTGGYRIRCECGQSTSVPNPANHVWEITLYTDGAIGVVTGLLAETGTAGVSNGTAFVGSTAVFLANSYALLTPVGTTSFTRS